MNNVALAFAHPSRSIAAITMLALLAWTLGLPAWILKAHADNVGFFTDTITDSDLGVAAIHTLQFTTANAMNGDEQFRIYFDEFGTVSTFDLAGLADTDLLANAVGFTAVNACTGGPTDEIDLSVGANFILGTICTGDTVPAGTITIQVGDTGKILNPTEATSSIISLQGFGATPIADEGDTRIAIIDNVTVTAAVDTIFTFSINPIGADITVNDDVTVTSGTSTATTVPFGILSPGTAKLMAQELRVDTNALNGFSVTVEADTTLTAGNGATIDTFIDALSTASSTLWQGPATTMGDTNTYGHWGVTTDDNVVSDAVPNRWGSGYATYQGNFVANPVEVFYHNTAVVNDAGQGVGSTTVAYKVEISELQEAAKDYQATLTYIATPVF